MIEMGINVNLIFRVYQLIPFYLLYKVPRYRRESEFIQQFLSYSLNLAFQRLWKVGKVTSEENFYDHSLEKLLCFQDLRNITEMT